MLAQVDAVLRLRSGVSESCIPVSLNEDCCQVVVFALGIGTKMEHADQLIAAFKVICQQCQRGQGPGAATELQQATLGKLQLVPSAIDQQLSLRDAFFAGTLRSVHLSSAEVLGCCTGGLAISAPSA